MNAGSMSNPSTGGNTSNQYEDGSAPDHNSVIVHGSCNEGGG
jgi:hypothetical protein